MRNFFYIRYNVKKGSAFDVFLPAIETDVTNQAEQAQMVITGSERILFVDDEDFQADIGKRMLERIGLTILYYAAAKRSAFKTSE